MNCYWLKHARTSLFLKEIGVVQITRSLKSAMIKIKGKNTYLFASLTSNKHAVINEDMGNLIISDRQTKYEVSSSSDVNHRFVRKGHRV